MTHPHVSCRLAEGAGTTEAVARVHSEAQENFAEGLGLLLADTATLCMKTHAFHWNVKDPGWDTLHHMFTHQYSELWAALEAIAARMRSLGSRAPGTYAEFAKLASTGDAHGIPTSIDMARTLIDGHETVAGTIRHLLPRAMSIGDLITATLLTKRLQAHEKTAVMLRTQLR